MNMRELLELRGLDTTCRVKLVRHMDARYDVYELYRTGHLETYQSYQGKPIFECDFIVSFIGMERSYAKFIGVYKVGRRFASRDTPVPRGFPYPEFATGDGCFYELSKCAGFEDLENRVVIDWGKSARMWHQRLSKKRVVEILPEGYVKEFPGFLEFVLDFDELVQLINHPDANREWHLMLSSVAGVYLIVDRKTGLQYVGSAYGKRGILGRWSTYAHTGHGGNEKLIHLIGSDPGYARNFQFTILRTLPRTLTAKEVIEYERQYKEKLGTKAFGLNLN